MPARLHRCRYLGDTEQHRARLKVPAFRPPAENPSPPLADELGYALLRYKQWYELVLDRDPFLTWYVHRDNIELLD